MKIIKTIFFSAMLLFSFNSINAQVKTIPIADLVVTGSSSNVISKNVESILTPLNIPFDIKNIKEIKSAALSPTIITKVLNYKKENDVSASINVKLDINNARSYTFLLTNGQEVNSVAIPIINTDMVYNYIESGSNKMDVYISYVYNSITQKLQIIPKYSGKRGWWGCMTNFFGSNVGTFVNLMGIAAGVGCIPCGVVAAFTTGAMALACIHGKTVVTNKPLLDKVTIKPIITPM